MSVNATTNEDKHTTVAGQQTTEDALEKITAPRLGIPNIKQISENLDRIQEELNLLEVRH